MSYGFCRKFHVLSSTAKIKIRQSYTEFKDGTLMRPSRSVHPSICLSLSGKNRRRDENGKGTMGCGSGWGCSGGLLGCKGREKTQKHAFRRGARYTFIISTTFDGGRLSLIV